MTIHGYKSNVSGLEASLKNLSNIYWNLTSSELYEHSVKKELAVLNDTGALAVDTGEFTGRSPKDRFIVKDDKTTGSVHWNNFNIPFEAANFDLLFKDMSHYLEGKDTNRYKDLVSNLGLK